MKLSNNILCSMTKNREPLYEDTILTVLVVTELAWGFRRATEKKGMLNSLVQRLVGV